MKIEESKNYNEYLLETEWIEMYAKYVEWCDYGTIPTKARLTYEQYRTVTKDGEKT